MRVPSKKKDMKGYQDRDLATAAMSSDDEEVVDSEVEREQEEISYIAEIKRNRAHTNFH